MILSSCGKTHVGMKRSHNEDCLRIFRDEHLYVVADGMGGHASGEVASEMSADTVAAFFRATSLDEDITWPYKYDYGQTYQENRIRVGVEMSNQRIFQSSVYDMKLKGMGTTIVALSFYDDKCSVGHVGDSRVYLIRRGSLEQITEDHSLLNDYIKLRPGGMTQEEIDAFPHKNVIVRALGMRDEVEVDVITREVEVGDILLLCSDGLSGMLTDLEMLDIINAATDRSGGVEHVDLDGLCDQLIASANQNGGNDNITVLLVRCDPADDPSSSLALHPQNTEGFTSSAHADLSNAQPAALNTPAQPAESLAESSAELSATPNPFAPAWSSSPSAPTPSPSPEASFTEANLEESVSQSMGEALTASEITPEIAPEVASTNGSVSANTPTVDSSDQAEASEDLDEARAEALVTGATQADAVDAAELTMTEAAAPEEVAAPELAAPEVAAKSEMSVKIEAKEEAEVREEAVAEAVAEIEATEAEATEAEATEAEATEAEATEAEMNEAEEPAFKDNDTILMRPPADVQAKVEKAEEKVDSTAKFTSTAEFVSAITTPAPNPQRAPEPQPIEEPQKSRFGDDATIRLMPADLKSDLKVGDAEEPTMRAAGVPLGSTALKTNTASNVEAASQEVEAVSAGQGASDAES